MPHSLHVHGLRYGIDSDGSWPFGTEAAHHGGRSDAICPGDTWIYTFDVPDNALGRGHSTITHTTTSRKSTRGCSVAS